MECSREHGRLRRGWDLLSDGHWSVRMQSWFAHFGTPLEVLLGMSCEHRCRKGWCFEERWWSVEEWRPTGRG